MPLNSAMLSGGNAGGQEDFGDDYGDEGEEDASIGAEGGAGGNPFAALAQNPNFAMIRQRILQDPNFYNQFMQQLAQSQPQLFAVIQQNPGAFMNLILGGDANIGGGPGASVSGGAPGGHAGHGGANPPGTIRVSQEEMEAITRLTQLGFPKHKAAEAYFACDKNEEYAANFLFESGVEDEETVLQRTIIESTAAQQQPPNPIPSANPEPSANADPNANPDPSSGSGAGNEGGAGAGQQPPAEGGDKKPDDDDSSLA